MLQTLDNIVGKYWKADISVEEQCFVHNAEDLCSSVFSSMMCRTTLGFMMIFMVQESFKHQLSLFRVLRYLSVSAGFIRGQFPWRFTAQPRSFFSVWLSMDLHSLCHSTCTRQVWNQVVTWHPWQSLIKQRVLGSCGFMKEQMERFIVQVVVTPSWYHNKVKSGQFVCRRSPR